MPKILEIEYTPNPDVARFILKEPITNGLPKNFNNHSIAEFDTLAKQLFALGDIKQVYMQNNYIVITKNNNVKWSELLFKLAPPIRQASSVLSQQKEYSDNVDNSNNNSDDFIKKINNVLKIKILPMLAADGGGLDVVGRNGKTIIIKYSGACSSCPSGTTGTLMAIEDILRRDVDPDIVVIPT